MKLWTKFKNWLVVKLGGTIVGDLTEYKTVYITAHEVHPVTIDIVAGVDRRLHERSQSDRNLKDVLDKKIADQLAFKLLKTEARDGLPIIKRIGIDERTFEDSVSYIYRLKLAPFTEEDSDGC